MHPLSQPARDLTRNAAILMAIGLLTGGFVSAAMTGKVNADPHAALASHLNALLGCFWMIGVAYSMPMLRYGEVGLRRLVWIVTIPNFSNWIVTAIKAFLRVPGVDYTGEARNDSIFGLLTALVVVPSFVAAGAWVYGFFGGRARVSLVSLGSGSGSGSGSDSGTGSGSASASGSASGSASESGSGSGYSSTGSGS